MNRRLRFFLSLVIATVAGVLARGLSFQFAFIVTWIAFAASYLVSSWYIVLSFHPKDVKALSKDEDASGATIFFIVLSSAVISLFAIILLLNNGGSSSRGDNYIFMSVAAVFCSWTLIHTIFTLRYAHLYYEFSPENEDQLPVLGFPGCDNPDYLDFAYFSFVLGMTFQVSDVVIQSKRLRRIALMHGLLSFVYNTVIVALSINIVSGLISK